jgi:hypothetical protein
MASGRKLDVFEQLLLEHYRALDLSAGAHLVQRRRSVDTSIWFNRRSEAFRVGTIVRTIFGAQARPSAQRGIIQSIRTERGNLIAIVDWVVGATRCRRGRPAPLDTLQPIGRAASTPHCHAFGVGGLGQWFKPRSEETNIGAVGKWCREMKRLLAYLRDDRSRHDPAVRPLLEARAVKLDHLLSIYGSLGRR